MFREMSLKVFCYSLFACSFYLSTFLLLRSVSRFLAVYLSVIEESFLQAFFMLIALITLAFSVRK